MRERDVLGFHVEIEGIVSAVAADVFGRQWASTLGRLWLRMGAGNWTCIWQDPTWPAPFIRLLPAAGVLLALTADGGCSRGGRHAARKRFEPSGSAGTRGRVLPWSGKVPMSRTFRRKAPTAVLLATLYAAPQVSAQSASSPASNGDTPSVGAMPAPSSSAEASPQTDQARDAFSLGTALANQGQWPEALNAFNRSSKLRPHPVTTYNLAYCERALGHYTRAYKLFRRTLVEHEAAAGGLSPGHDEGEESEARNEQAAARPRENEPRRQHQRDAGPNPSPPRIRARARQRHDEGQAAEQSERVGVHSAAR